MAKEKVNYTNIDEYIASFPQEVQERMERLRQAIQKMAPDATEKISWDMPTFYLKGNLVHFAAFKNHIGFYPGDSGVSNFLEDVAQFKHSKGAIQFPMKEPLPLELVEKIVAFRVKENLEKKA